MKQVLLPVFLLLTTLVLSTYAVEPCLLEPEVGNCRAAIPRWYFDPESMTCKMFSWGGCGGVVPFVTEKDCENASCPSNPCVMEPEVGNCRASIERWFYNRDTGACEKFFWGGCGGSVPFQTELECQNAQCNNACSQVPDGGFCKARFIRWYFDNDTGECTEFIWGGCGGSVPFNSLADCQAAGCDPVEEPEPTPVPLKDRCTLQPQAGPCEASIPKWYWDAKNAKCATFRYGGCFGVVPFDTEKECEKAGCGPPDCLLLPKDVQPLAGPCKALFTSWYFDRRTYTCKPHTYSGCRNVGPFSSQTDCNRARCRTRLCALDRPQLTFGCTKGKRVSWYFDSQGKGACRKATGDGCANGYVFASKKECRKAKCQGQRCFMKPMDVDARPSQVQCVPRPKPWYYDRRSKRCVQFTADGCDKRMPFPSKKSCKKSCS